MSIHPEHSPDQSLRAEGGANIAQATIHGERVKGWLTTVLLGLSIAINVWLILAYQAAQREQRLQQYNLDWFKTHEFADLRSEVEVDQKLITAFGPKNCRR